VLPLPGIRPISSPALAKQVAIGAWLEAYPDGRAPAFLAAGSGKRAVWIWMEEADTEDTST